MAPAVAVGSCGRWELRRVAAGPRSGVEEDLDGQVAMLFADFLIRG